MSSGPRVAGVATTGFMAPFRTADRARSRLTAGLLPAAVAACVGVLLAPAPAMAIDEFPVAPGINPGGITAGPDGALWFVEEGTNTIGRITTTGVVTNHFPVPAAPASSVSALDQITAGPDGALWFTQPRDNQIGRLTTAGGMPAEFTFSIPDAEPEGITVGPDGALWFTAAKAGKIGRITTAGVFDPPTGFPPSGIAGEGISDITVGPDGALWFTESTGNRIGRITTGGTITHYDVPTSSSDPSGITPGPGGLWFTEFNTGQLAQITTAGLITEYPGAGVGPSAIAVGRDGALWYTESDPSANAIGRMTTGGAVTNHFPVPTPGSEPSDITTGPDGALWFTEFLGNKIGRIETAPPFVPPPPPPPVSILTPVKRKPCTVPKVRGLSLRKAKKKLKRAKCRYRIRGTGRVVSTSPKAGKRTTKTVVVKAKPKRPKGSPR
jgi:virginiamycin B lyase